VLNESSEAEPLAEIEFVHFHGRTTAAHRHVKATLAQYFAKAVHPEPRRLVRNAKRAMDLMSRDALFKAISMNSAAGHFESGILERSKAALTGTVNCSQHSLH
jgi:hypothetical protein